MTPQESDLWARHEIIKREANRRTLRDLLAIVALSCGLLAAIWEAVALMWG
jgi:hypothetical protein